MASTAKEIMVKEVATVFPATPLVEAAGIMHERGFSGVPVVDKNHTLVGILTEYDIVSKGALLRLNSLEKFLREPPKLGDGIEASDDAKALSRLIVADAMNPEPMVFYEDTSLEDVVSTFREHHRVNPVPVVDKDHKVVGIVSRYDLVKVFVSMTAHQLSVPLTAISWSAESLLKGIGGELTKEQREYVEQMYNQVKALQETVSLFLNVARIESGVFALHPGPVRLAKTAEEVFFGSTQGLRKRNLKFEKLFSDEMVVIDERIFRIVFQNLLSNATKYTPDGGTVSAEVKAENNKVLIKVSDTGIGISKDAESKIFSKYFRSPAAQNSLAEGTGLGLYLVKMMADRAGGKVWFVSPGESSKGTTFYVELPLKG